MADNSARIAELTTDLTGVRSSIRAIVKGGQAYSAEGRAMTRADLRSLRELEKSYVSELAELKRGGQARIYGAVFR